MSVGKKVLISVIFVTAAVVLCLLVTLAVLFYPRKISSYLKINAEQTQEIYIEYFNSENDESKFYLPEDDYAEFLKELKSVKTVRTYTKYKSEPRYSFYISDGSKIYKINELGVYQKKTEEKYFSGKNFRVKNNALDEIYKKYAQ